MVQHAYIQSESADAWRAPRLCESYNRKLFHDALQSCLSVLALLGEDMRRPHHMHVEFVRPHHRWALTTLLSLEGEIAQVYYPCQ